MAEKPPLKLVGIELDENGILKLPPKGDKKKPLKLEDEPEAPKRDMSSPTHFSQALDELAKKHGVSRDFLESRATAMGQFIPTGDKMKDLKRSAASALFGVIGEGMGGGAPSWAYKKLQATPEEAAAMDELRDLIKQGKSPTKQVAEIVSGVAAPSPAGKLKVVEEAGRIKKLIPFISQAAESGVYSMFDSKEGQAVLETLKGMGYGSIIPGFNKVYNKARGAKSAEKIGEAIDINYKRGMQKMQDEIEDAARITKQKLGLERSNIKKNVLDKYDTPADDVMDFATKKGLVLSPAEPQFKGLTERADEVLEDASSKLDNAFGKLDEQVAGRSEVKLSNMLDEFKDDVATVTQRSKDVVDDTVKKQFLKVKKLQFAADDLEKRIAQKADAGEDITRDLVDLELLRTRADDLIDQATLRSVKPEFRGAWKDMQDILQDVSAEFGDEEGFRTMTKVKNLLYDKANSSSGQTRIAYKTLADLFNRKMHAKAEQLAPEMSDAWRAAKKEWSMAQTLNNLISDKAGREPYIKNLSPEVAAPGRFESVIRSIKPERFILPWAGKYEALKAGRGLVDAGIDKTKEILKESEGERLMEKLMKAERRKAIGDRFRLPREINLPSSIPQRIRQQRKPEEEEK